MRFDEVKKFDRFKKRNWDHWAEFDYYGRLVWFHSKKPVIVYAEDFESDAWIADVAEPEIKLEAWVNVNPKNIEMRCAHWTEEAALRCAKDFGAPVKTVKMVSEK